MSVGVTSKDSTITKMDSQHKTLDHEKKKKFNIVEHTRVQGRIAGRVTITDTCFLS